MFPQDEPTDSVSSQPSPEAQERETEDKVNEARGAAHADEEAAKTAHVEYVTAQATPRKGEVAGFIAVGPVGGWMLAFPRAPGFDASVPLADLMEKLDKPGNQRIGYAVLVDERGEAWLERVLLPTAAPVVAQGEQQG